MRYALILTLLFLSVQADAKLNRPKGGGSTDVVPNEEFVGPLAGWQDVTAAPCNAAGNGATDDAAAFQTCINNLSSSAPVLWIPAHTYKIGSTLTFPSINKIQFLCADPSTTTLKWSGGAGTMMLITNTSYSKFSRCTLDGNSAAAIIVDSDAGGNLNTGTEWSDMVFRNAGIAFRCGQSSGQCAEQSMIRDQFINNTDCGISMRGQNALDVWVWYSLFQNNQYSLSNACITNGAGNFAVYKSNFFNNFADFVWGNTQFWGIRWNYSTGANQFLAAGGTGGQDNTVLQSNSIVNTVGQPVRLSDAGPMVLLNNTMSQTGVSVGPLVTVGNGGAGVGELFSMNNVFTASSPTSAVNRENSVNDTTVGGVNPPVPALPPTPPNVSRTVFEVSAIGSGSTGCTSGSPCALNTTTLNNAAAAGSRTVVHLRAGTYTVNATLIVPASDIQISGDENVSLNASGLAGAPVFKLIGPSKVVMRDFFISGQGNTADGIEIDGADQSGARVFIDQPVITTGSATAIFSDQLAHTTVEVHNHQLGNNFAGASVKVLGTGSASDGQTNLFMGQDAGSHVIYDVSLGGTLVATDCFCGDEQENIDQNAGHAIANIGGGGSVAISGGLYARYTLPGDVAMKFMDFRGNSSITGAHVYGETAFSGTGTGTKNAGLGMVNGRKQQGFPNSGTSAGNPTLHFGTSPSVANGLWVVDFSVAAAIPSSLVSPTTVLSSTGTTVTMSNNAASPGVSSGNQISFFVPTTFAQTDSSTIEYLNPITDYNSNANQDPQALPEVGTASKPFLDSALAVLLNTQPVVPSALAAGVTDVRLYRIMIDSAVNAIHVKN